MADGEHGALGPAGALKWPRYEPGDYLAASDLATAQVYRGQRLRRHNRHLHGWGVVCGLWVAPARDATRPWAVLVCPGYALGPFGDEILVCCATAVDVRESLWARPASAGPFAYIGIRYADVSEAPVIVVPPGCGCPDGVLHDMRVDDGFRVDVLWRLPDDPVLPPFDFCSDLPPCPPCPDSPYVLLASVRLPADEGDTIDAADIDNGIRKTL